MDGSIIAVPRSAIQAKARAAFARGVCRDGHEFNWHSTAAIAVWQHTWDLCAAEKHATEVAEKKASEQAAQLAEACPP
jgi:hypothetical protein